MKRMAGRTLVLLLALLTLWAVLSAPASAQSLVQRTYNTISFTRGVDSTKLAWHDTILYNSGTSSEMLRLGPLTGGTITGYWLVELVTLDTGTAGTKVDTTKDTIWLQLLTGDRSSTTPSKVIYSKYVTGYIPVAGTATSTNYSWFQDSTIKPHDLIWARLITGNADSIVTRARLDAKAHYRLTASLTARP